MLDVVVADGQSIAGMGAQAMPRSLVFGLQFLVEASWRHATTDSRLKALSDGACDAAALRAAAAELVVSVELGEPRGFPLPDQGWRYNEDVERGRREPAGFWFAVTVRDPAVLAHLRPGAQWDAPCGLFE